MSSWPCTRLSELCSVHGGGTPTRTNPNFYGADIPWVTPKDMKTWSITGSQVGLTELGLRSGAAKLIPENAILIVIRSGVLKHTLPVAVTRVPVSVNQDMKALVCGPEVDVEYLARYIKWKTPEILQWVRATTADNFSINTLKELPVPLPPLPEQRHIATILDTSSQILDARKPQSEYWPLWSRASTPTCSGIL